MRILLVGAGGVGSAFTGIAVRRDFFELCVVSDYDRGRATKAVEALGDDRFVAAQVDASSADAVTALCEEHQITHVMNAVDPVFNMPIFDGAYAAGADYLDMAMSLSSPHRARRPAPSQRLAFSNCSSPSLTPHSWYGLDGCGRDRLIAMSR